MSNRSSNKPSDVVEVLDVLTPKNLGVRYERALGRLAIRFSLLHSLLENFAWDTWGLHPEFSRILTKDLPFKQLVGKLRASMKELELEDDTNRELKRILNQAEKLAEERNEFLHALWIIEKNKPVLCVRRHKKEADSKAPTVQEIDKLNESIIETANDLIDFSQRNPLMTPIAIAQKRKYGSKSPPPSKQT